MRHGVITRARLIDESVRRGGHRTYPVMITLTYLQPGWWGRYHVTGFLHCLRGEFARWGQPLRYCWVAELQKRGAVHYHVVVWMPRGRRLRKPDQAGWWVHGSTRIEGARNAVGYLAKYVSKGSLEGAQFPRGLRLHGAGGLDPAARTEARWWAAPKWVRALTTQGDDVRRLVGGFVVLGSGEFLPTPWAVELHAGRIFIFKPG